MKLVLKRLSECFRLMIGIPDYNNYVAHQKKHHPQKKLMTYEEFFLERQKNRYGRSSSGTRCC
jgi:uncharacterized short protein YbdD (DUF466 family)